MTKSNLAEPELVQLRIEHLKMIQAVIARMSGFSAGIKNFCVTVTVALAAFWIKDPNVFAIALDAIVIVSFAALDSYYLAAERNFVSLYSQVGNSPLEGAADLSIPGPNISLAAAMRASSSLSVAGFYAPFLAALALLMVLSLNDAQPAPKSVVQPAAAKVQAPNQSSTNPNK